MDTVKVNGVSLAYEVKGSGEPVLLIGTGPFADSFLPLLTEEALDGHRLIRYRQRGQVGGIGGSGPVSFADHAVDAVGLLDRLGVGRAHIAGHSTGAAIALQLVHDSPERVHSLILLEPPLMGVPSAGSFLARIGPAVEAFEAGDLEGAMRHFLTIVTGLDWTDCEEVVERRVPGGVAQALSGSRTFFERYLPALESWRFGEEQAVEIEGPVLSVTGAETDRLFSEGCDLLRTWIRHVEERWIEGVGHLLHMQRPEPVARRMADFLRRHPIGVGADQL